MKTIDSNKRYRDNIRSMESRYFVGRDEELKQMKELLVNSGKNKRIINISGTGGVGKTYLLQEFSSLCEQTGALLIELDARDFYHSANGFFRHVLTILDPHFAENPTSINESQLHHTCIHLLNSLSKEQKIVLALDSYEELRGMGRWLREVFISQLDSEILIVISGRNPLDGQWISSPGWRESIHSIPLKDLNRDAIIQYLQKFSIKDKSTIENVCHFTGGHPLVLSFVTSILSSGKELSFDTFEQQDIWTHLIDQWLREIPDDKFRVMIEAACVLRQFNQESLEYVLEQAISYVDFKILTNLSFIQYSGGGWKVHKQVREAVYLDLLKRNPTQHKKMTKNCITYYLNKVKSSSQLGTIQEAREFFYHVGDSMVRSVLFAGGTRSYHYETMDHDNYHEILQYYEHRKMNPADKKASYYDASTNRMYQFQLSSEQDKKRSELFQPEKILELGMDAVRMLKNEAGELLGIVVIIPINKQTMAYLSEDPVSAPYFKILSEQQKKELSVPASTQSGWFIRVVDVVKPDDSEVRSELMTYIISFFLTKGIVLVTTPVTFYQNLLEWFGFSVIPDATHFEYGEGVPSYTYMLDLRGDRQKEYIHHFIEKLGLQTEDNIFGFSDREKEISKLIMDGKTNPEIAATLFVSEITVKKHISSMLKKAGVKNRAQLVKKMMDESNLL